MVEKSYLLIENLLNSRLNPLLNQLDVVILHS